MHITYPFILSILLVMFGILFIAYGIWLWHLSGFTFYMTSGLFAGLAYLGAAALVLALPDWTDFILFFGGTLFVMPIKSIWEEARERCVRKARPSEWSAWENTIAQQPSWAKWLLSSIQWRMHQVAKESVSSLK